MSILAALDGQSDGGAAPAPHRNWPWAVGLGTVAVALLATVLLSHTDDGAMSHVVAANTSAPQPLPPVPAFTTPAPAAAPPAAAPASQLAALEILAAAPLAAAAPNVNAMATAPASAPLPAATSKTPKDNGARDNGAARVSDNRQQARPPATVQGTHATKAVAKTAPTAARPTARPGVTAPSAAQTAARSGDDADVDLIAALMQHLNRQETTDGGAPMTIADLVGRCKGLAAADAQRCQRRICDNYWGRAEACPRHLAPRELAVRP